jgi:NAD(P)-dependent dehydrogenase (short-subunit alcohol dehydrogenase family)
LNDTSDTQFALITGAAGALGQALVYAFDEAGYSVIGTDRAEPPPELPLSAFLSADLNRSVIDATYATTLFTRIREIVADGKLKVLVNNAATQVLGSSEDLSYEDWSSSLNTNLLAPFFWIQNLLADLEAAKGGVINIGSIHARLTKPNFSAYATSKAGLAALSRSLAVELGGRISINTIEPAAIRTPMLLEGFNGDPKKLQELLRHHPTNSIGETEEVAKLAVLLASSDLQFLTGCSINIDGGVSARLHDPD